MGTPWFVQKQELKKLSVAKQSQHKLDPTEIFLLKQVSLDDPKC